MQFAVVLQVAGLRLVADPRVYAAAVMNGTAVYKLKDGTGAWFTDHRLLESLAQPFGTPPHSHGI